MPRGALVGYDFDRFNHRLTAASTAITHATQNAGNIRDWLVESTRRFREWEDTQIARRAELARQAQSGRVPEHELRSARQATVGASGSMAIEGGSQSEMSSVTHGDGADAVDPNFGRDAESSGAQKAMANKIWNICPRIYDDEIIVRQPLHITTYSGATEHLTLSTTLASTGPYVPWISGNISANTIQLNNLFTPYPNDTSLKPRGYAWYSQLYTKYQVLETKWTIIITCNTCIPTGTDAVNTSYHTNIPHVFYAQTSDTTHPSIASEKDLMELAHSNGAAKTMTLERPKEIDFLSGYHGLTNNTVTFQGTWTPAKFDDLEVDITRQPISNVGAVPNWINYLDIGAVNYNTALPTAQTNPISYSLTYSLEFLVHYKKILYSKYATDN